MNLRLIVKHELFVIQRAAKKTFHFGSMLKER